MSSQILKFIDLIRGDIDENYPKDTSVHIITEIFTTGNCGNTSPGHFNWRLVARFDP